MQTATAAQLGGDSFYPTPPQLASKMLDGVDFDIVSSVLEPSAGKGDLAEAVALRLRARRLYSSRDDYSGTIDCVEIDPNLRHILKGKGYRVVHDDFLTYQTAKRYDLIVMNPPFSEGARHLLKALELMPYGGHVVCLLNAETLRNPYTNERKALMRRLDELGVQIEYVKGAFSRAERGTGVEIAIVKADIPSEARDSLILDHLKAAEKRREAANDPTAITHKDFIEAIVARYRFEVDAGIRLIGEYKAILPYTLDAIREEKHPRPVLELRVDTERYGGDDTVNGYVRAMRLKYWEALFQAPEFVVTLTTNLQQELRSRVQALSDYEFSVVNIKEIQLELSRKTLQGVEDTIVALFDELSHKHHWYDETSKNAHYFDGWKTNKAWIINKKVIIPLRAHSTWDSEFRPDYNASRKLSDIEKVFDYLDAGRTDPNDLGETLSRARAEGQTKKIPLKYFDVTFFKKGTCHIEFRDLDLLKKFNLYGSQRKGWLPPSYGKARYEDMEAEEQAVVDSFEGKSDYERTVREAEFFLPPKEALLRLGAGLTLPEEDRP